MGMNKKGIFFTITAITLVSLFLLSYGAYTITQNRESVNDRVTTMNDFVTLIEDDLPRKIFISGFRIIFLLEKFIIENGTYIPNVNESFQELFHNGTIYTVAQDPSLIQGIIYSDIIDDITTKAQSVSINVTMNNPRLYVSQDDPWNVRLNFTIDMFLEDIGKLALWNRTFSTIVYIPVEGFEDPLYVINTNGLVANAINKTPYVGFVSPADDVTNLTDHYEQSYYIASTTAPSFLQRLEGNFSANAQGIESMVNRQQLESQGITTQEKSVIDYIYFNSTYSPTPICPVTGMPTLFRIVDVDNHFTTYDVHGGITGPPC